MYWSDEGYLLSKNSFDENSIIVEIFTLKHGKCSGIVYGGSSKKQITLRAKTHKETKLIIITPIGWC